LQKIALIVICIIFLSGCALSKYRKRENISFQEQHFQKGLLSNVIKQNLTNCSYFIKKAEIEISSNSFSEKFLSSIKFEYPDKYLVSLKSKTGIEAARIFVSRDTILINDRINRKMYYGSAFDVQKKYGIDNSDLSLLFGDFISDSLPDINVLECFNGKLSIDKEEEGRKKTYIIDCRKAKIVSFVYNNKWEGPEREINYSGFGKTGDKLFPGTIEFKDVKNKLFINILIRILEYPWNGSIEFIPGSKYELIRLL
jgi:hypothetical protein